MRIVRHKRSEKLYAMKYINKEKCIAQSAVKNTLLERNLLEAIEHPLIVNLRYQLNLPLINFNEGILSRMKKTCSWSLT